MKHYLLFIISAGVIFILTSCSTSTKVTVMAEPGTEILTPGYSRLAVADNTGNAKFKIPDDNHYAFLFSHRPNTDTYVPFALDYKYKSFSGSKFLKGVSYFLSSAGLLSMITGVIIIAAGDTDTGVIPMVAGTAAALSGVGIGLTSSSRLEQTNHEYRYKYLAVQKANDDLPLTRLAIEPISLATETNTIIPVQPLVTPTVDKNDASSVSSRKLSQKSTKTLKDYGNQLQGTYIGSGKLTKGNETIETYNDMKVFLKRVSKDVVSVNVEDSSGEKFFPSDSNYKIVAKKDGSFILTLEGISVATITIDKNKNLIYLHPRVNIDGDIYTLTINAKL